MPSANAGLYDTSRHAWQGVAMRIFLSLFVGSTLLATACPNGKFVLALHGGAGKWNIPIGQWEKYKSQGTKFLEEGYVALKAGETSLNVVQRLVEQMEDSGAYNAGKGATRNSEGKVELDASIMDGKTLKAGAVGAVQTLKNPIRAARAVMDKTTHVLLVAKGAEAFGVKQGLATVDPSYFEEISPKDRSPWGTVGAVALDCFGDLAAATSTGGLSGKLPSRVGDSPIVGAGNYANSLAAVSGTGKGDYFIRTAATRDVAALMEYQKLSLKGATDTVLKKIVAIGGEGGFIAVDKNGNIAAPFTTAGMMRGYVREDGKAILGLYPGELEALGTMAISDPQS